MGDYDYTQFLKKGIFTGMSCCNCGETIGPMDAAMDCPDCGGVFCENCVNDGSFENHNCEDEDDDY